MLVGSIIENVLQSPLVREICRRAPRVNDPTIPEEVFCSAVQFSWQLILPIDNSRVKHMQNRW